jgi:hypothetical protein
MLKIELPRWTGLRLRTAQMQVSLVLLLMAAMVMTSCANKGGYTETDVILSFMDTVREQVNPELPRDVMTWWLSTLPLAKVEYIEERDTYEITFPNFGGEGVELWGIDMESSQIWPENAGALLSAIALFCRDRNDQRLDCQLWFAQLDALVESMKK